jgi:hypothetical protein
MWLDPAGLWRAAILADALRNPWISVDDALGWLSCSRRQLEEAVTSGRIRGKHTAGRLTHVHRRDLQRIVKAELIVRSLRVRPEHVLYT